MEYSSARDPWTWTQEEFLRWSKEAAQETDRMLWKALADNHCNGEILLTSVDHAVLKHFLGVQDLRWASALMATIENLRKQSSHYQRHKHTHDTYAHEQSTLIEPFEELRLPYTDDASRWHLLEVNPSGFKIVPAESHLPRSSGLSIPADVIVGVPTTVPTVELDHLSVFDDALPTLDDDFSYSASPDAAIDQETSTTGQDGLNQDYDGTISVPLLTAGLNVEKYFTCELRGSEDDEVIVSMTSPSEALLEKLFVQKLLKRAFMQDFSTTTVGEKRQKTAWDLYKRPQSTAILRLIATGTEASKLTWSTSSLAEEPQEPVLSVWFQQIDWDERLAKHDNCVNTEELPPFGESDSGEDYSSDLMEEIDREQQEEIKFKEQGTSKSVSLERVISIVGRCEVNFEKDWSLHRHTSLEKKSYRLWQRFHLLPRKFRRMRREQIQHDLRETELRHRKLYDAITAITFLSERAVEYQAESMRQTTYLENDLNYLARLYDKGASCPPKLVDDSRKDEHGQGISGRRISSEARKSFLNEQEEAEQLDYQSTFSASDESSLSSFVIDDVPDIEYHSGKSDLGSESESSTNSSTIGIIESPVSHKLQQKAGVKTTARRSLRFKKRNAIEVEDDASEHHNNCFSQEDKAVGAVGSPKSVVSDNLSGPKSDLLNLTSDPPAENKGESEHSRIDECPQSTKTAEGVELMIDLCSSEASDESEQIGRRRSKSSKRIKHKNRVKRVNRRIDSASESETEDETSASKKRRRRRPIPVNQQAAARRRQQQEEREEIARRARDQNAAQSEDVIINPGDIEVGFDIAIEPQLASCLKPHQLEGIRFMWRETIMMSEVRGCLLAHTMGLGKTLQVITYVDTLGRTITTSKNWLPQELRRPYTLILCPASLVQNWTKEIDFWTPHNAMGRTFQPSLEDDNIYRLETLRSWKEEGGILVLSYTLFTAMINNQSSSGRPMYKKQKLASEVQDLLESTARVVVADEAHMFKNDLTKLAKAVRRVKCKARIALTGSPLANNLTEYWAIMDWIEEGHLGSKRDFRSEFVLPIEAGNKGYSTKSQVRQGQRQLKMLLGIIGAKIDRRNLTCLRTLLPSKFEYVLFLRFHPLQKALYNSFLAAFSVTKHSLVAQQLFLISRLKWICNFPGLFHQNHAGKKPIYGKHNSLTTPTSDPNDNYTSVQTLESQVSLADIEAREPTSESLSIAESWWQAALTTFGERVDDVHTSTKVTVLLAICKAAREQNDKVLIFSFSLPTIRFLEKLLVDHSLGPVRKITGSSGAKDRVRDVASFNSLKGYATCLISTKAGGQGLNMAQANRVVLFDHEFNPVWAEQAVGRAYRMGQTKSVYVYRLQIDDSFEIPLFQLALQKLGLSSKVVDKKNIQSKLKKKEGLFAYLHPAPDSGRDPEEVGAIEDQLLQQVISECPGHVIAIDKTEAFHIDEDNELDAADLVEIQAKQDAYWRDQDRKKNEIQHIQALPTTYLPPHNLPMSSFLRDYPSHVNTVW